MSAKIRLRPRKRLRFETDIAGHCNLNCKCCNHFSPLIKEYFVKPELFEKDFSRLSELAGRNNENIDLMGGEPLLHPDITEFFRISRTYFPIGRINLFTNGTLLLKQKDYFYEQLKKYKISILATKYPTIDWDRIEKKMSENDVKIDYAGVIGNTEKVSWHCPLDLNGSQDIQENFTYCGGANNCIFLHDGRLFTCSMAPNFHHFSKYFNKNIELSDKDSINIHEAKDIKEILEFLAKPIPACRYCKVFGFSTRPWSKSKREIKEWI